jgi:hypothetical protein
LLNILAVVKVDAAAVELILFSLVESQNKNVPFAQNHWSPSALKHKTAAEISLSLFNNLFKSLKKEEEEEEEKREEEVCTCS